jgi:hypothetical protein
MVCDRIRTSAFTHDRHARGIAAESANVILNPPHRKSLIEYAIVASAAFGVTTSQKLAGCKTENIESVVESGNDELTFRKLHSRNAVVEWQTARTHLEAPTVNPQEDWL